MELRNRKTETIETEPESSRNVSHRGSSQKPHGKDNEAQIKVKRKGTVAEGGTGQ